MIISLDLVKIILKTAFKNPVNLAEGKAFIQKAGGTLLGNFSVEAGGSAGEVVSITKWDSLDARSQGFLKTTQDPESLEYHKRALQGIKSVRNYLCIPHPEVDMDKFNITRRSALHMYRCRMGDPMAMNSAKMYLDFSKIYEESGAHSTLEALLVPIAFDGPINLIAIHQLMEESFDKALEKGMHTLEEHAKPMQDIQDHLELVSNRFLTPIDEKMIAAYRAMMEQ